MTTLFAIVSLVLYFLPSIIAAVRDHENGGLIAVINTVLGWTVLGWIAALALSVAGKGRSDEPAAAARIADSGAGNVSDLEKLAALRDSGALTEREYAAAKARLLKPAAGANE